MITLPEQFSAVRQQQVDAQLAFFQDFGTRAVAGAEQLLALNLSTARASVEKTSAAVRQLWTVRDPRDLLALTTSTQEQFDSLLAYGRALAGIATGLQAAAPASPAPALLAAAPEQASAVAEPDQAEPEVPAAKPTRKK